MKHYEKPLSEALLRGVFFHQEQLKHILQMTSASLFF